MSNDLRRALRQFASGPAPFAMLVLVVLVSLLLGTGSAGGSVAVQNGPFSFAAQGPKEGDSAVIWFMNANGSGRKALTRHGNYDNIPGLEDSEPDWAPNGRTIAFTRSRQAPNAPEAKTEIDVMNANGSSQTRLTRTAFSDHSPAWSPDGKKIAFVRDHVIRSNGYGEIYVMNANGSGQTRLTQVVENGCIGSTTLAAWQPVWSPDGTRIAFTGKSADYPCNDELRVMNADGSGQTVLTGNGMNASQPDWSPDGTKIAFRGEDGGAGSFEVFVINANGSGQTKLTHNDGACPYGCPNNEIHVQPTWSPDGRKIAYTRHIPGKTIDQRSLYDLYVANPDGSGQALIKRDVIEAVDWSPVAYGAANPLRPPPRGATAHPSLRLRCLSHVQAVPGHVFEARVVPSAGIRWVNFRINGRNYGEFSIPPIFIRMQVSMLPKRGTWTVKATVLVVGNEAQTVWVKRVLTKRRHAGGC
jgi:Tol biopolymer transport system component